MIVLQTDYDAWKVMEEFRVREKLSKEYASSLLEITARSYSSCVNGFQYRSTNATRGVGILQQIADATGKTFIIVPRHD